MSQSQSSLRRQGRVTVEELRNQNGLFSFKPESTNRAATRPASKTPDVGLRPGGVIEWLTDTPGTGAMSGILRLLASFPTDRRFWAIVDPSRECYLPAFSGWGIDINNVLLLRPNTLQELSWTVEQCLRSTALSATCAWIDHRFATRVHRRWQLAAETGGGIGVLFRPMSAQREPTWADIRLRAIPSTQGNPATRRLNIEVLYRRGGLGCGSQAWEIDHAQGHVHLVP